MNKPRHFADLEPLLADPRQVRSLEDLDATLDDIQQKHHPGSWPLSEEAPGFLDHVFADDELEEEP